MLAFMLAASVAASNGGAKAQLDAALRSFSSARATIEREIGVSQTVDLAYRLVQDQDSAALAPPASYRADWQDALQQEVALDTQAIEDLAMQSPHDMTPKRTGLYEVFVRSRSDGLLLPVAIYVPVNARRGGPLAVMLHGRDQSETNLLGQPYFRRLADRTGTVLVAPYARGTYNYEGVAEHDVYDVLAAAQSAFAPDVRRLFLVGYSMGGFGVFKIGPHYAKWSAIMDISGALEGSPNFVSFSWRTTPLYIVTGKNDSTVAAVYPERTAAMLSQLGLPAGLYEQHDGTHAIRTLVPALTAAWLDMHNGVVHSQST